MGLMSTPQTPPSEIRSTAALARQLGLSRWTVSRVLNGHPGIREATRQRVLAAMGESGFTPNPLARGLRGGRTGVVGVCVQEVESPILARKAMLLQEALRERGSRALLELTGGRAWLEAEVIRHFLSIRVDGLVLFGSSLDESDPVVAEMSAQGVPTVAIDPVSRLPFKRFELDRQWAVRLSLEHLHALGHQRIAVLGYDAEVAYGDVRVAALEAESKRLGLASSNLICVMESRTERHDYDYGWRLGQQLLSRTEVVPTGLLALNDRVALGAMRALREGGLRAPKDYSIIGFDNLDVTAFSEPALTTVDQRSELLIEGAVKALREMMEHPTKEIPEPTVIRPVILPRNSTGPAAG